MASANDHPFHKEPEEASNHSTSNPVCAVTFQQQDGNSAVSISCPDAPESSEDDPLFKREKIKRPLKRYKATRTSYNSTDVLLIADGTSNDEKNPERRHTKCVDLFNRYQNFAIKFRNSYYILIFQLWYVMLPISALYMANKWADSCPASPNLVNVSVLTGLCGVLLAGQWSVLVCCSAENRPCEGQQKYLIFFFFLLVTGFLELEIYIFSHLSVSFDPSVSNYCSRTFYNYTYYKFIASFASALLVVVLYFPGYPELASGVVCSNPLATTCYRQMMEEDD